jgi:predicted DNA-binding protein
MNITLPLEAQEEAKLLAAAKAKGVSAAALVREAVNRLIAEIPGPSVKKEPTRSVRGLLERYGSAPSAEEIDKNRVEMLKTLSKRRSATETTSAFRHHYDLVNRPLSAGRRRMATIVL